MLISGQFAIFLLILRILYMPAPSGKVPRKQANTRLQSVLQMRLDGIGSVLKHFPGYGNNADTHTELRLIIARLSKFRNKIFFPFETGVKPAQAAILVSHNIINCMDATLPASLSLSVHQILRVKAI